MKLIYKIPINIDKKHLSLNKIYAGVHWAKRKKDKDEIWLLVRSVVGMQKPLEKPVKIKLLNDDNDEFVKQIIMEKQKEFKGVIVEVEEI